MNTINKFLSSKKTAWIFLVISLVYRVVSVLHVSFIGRDKIILMQQSRNLLNGKGLSIAQYYVESIDNPVYDFTPFWPPGYPVLLAPFLKVFNYDTYWATTSVDVIFSVVFVLLVRKIVIELNFPTAAVNLITLIAGCFEYAFIYKSLPTDIPAFVFFLTGLLLLLRTIKNEKTEPLTLVITSCFLFLPCTFRYSYPPLSIAAPLAIIFLGWYLKRKMFIKKGLISFIVTTTLIVIFLGVLKSTTGSTGYIVDTGRGFFPENFLYWSHLVTESFINTIFTTSQVINKTGISLPGVIKLLQIINAILFLALILVFVYLFFKRKYFATGSHFSNFLFIGFFISAATCASLSYLSVTYRPQPGWGNYLGEPRYFMFVNLFLQTAFIGWIFLHSSWKKSLFQKIIIVCFSFLLFVEVTHNIYLYTKVVIFPDKYSAPDEEPDYIYFISAMDSLVHSNPGEEIWVVSDHDDFFPLMANYLGHKGIYKGGDMLKGLPVIKRETILVFALYDNEMADYQSFLDIHKAKLLNRVNYVTFYKVDLSP